MASRLGGRLSRPITFARIGGQPQRTIYDQQHSTNQTPGQVARAKGRRPSPTSRSTRPTTASALPYNYYWTNFQRDSIDGQGLPMLGMVHYGLNYDNAFWDNVRTCSSAMATARS